MISDILIAIMWDNDDLTDYMSYVESLLNTDIPMVFVKNSVMSIAYWQLPSQDYDEYKKLLNELYDNLAETISWISIIIKYDEPIDTEEISNYLTDEHKQILEELFYVKREIFIDPISLLEFNEY